MPCSTWDKTGQRRIRRLINLRNGKRVGIERNDVIVVPLAPVYSWCGSSEFFICFFLFFWEVFFRDAHLPEEIQLKV